MLINPHLRRIDWALNQPSFLNLENSAQYFQSPAHQAKIDAILNALDQNPSRVNDYFDSLPPMPLGRYFEQLLFYILDQDPFYKVHWENKQIVDEQGITRGEIDLILENAAGEIEHWEIALKYYLQVQNSPDHLHYIGPSRKDFLAKKMKRLFENQLKQSKSPLALSEFGEIPSKVFLKGELYFPNSQSGLRPQNFNAQANIYEWIPFSEFKKLKSKDSYFKVLFKPDWLGPYLCKEATSLTSFENLLEELQKLFDELYRPQMIIEARQENDYFVEDKRVFVLPPNWPA